MNNEEKRLYFDLCSGNLPNKEKLETRLATLFTPEVLGWLFANRMQAVAYCTLRDAELLGAVPREFRSSLSDAHRQNVEKNRAYFACLQQLSAILTNQHGRYAMLKGAVLCKLYPEGCRTSNDVDLLVRAEDVSTVGAALSAAGFRQGYIRAGRFVPATRTEIISSKMMRGETVPYILDVNLPWMPFLEVDINFSVDYKNDTDGIVDTLLTRAVDLTMGDLTVTTLNKEDFFLHLCAHLYKEATTLPWVQMRRDMTLYKYYDIYTFLKTLTSTESDSLCRRAAELEISDLYRCVIEWTNALFKDTQLPNDSLFHTVLSPADGKTFIYKEKDIQKRFFMKSREKNLEEINP